MRKIGDILKNFLELPEIDVGTFLGGRRPLVLAPHPDDESLGCGGLIAAACNTGLVPAVVVLTNGAASHPGSLEYPPEKLSQLREREAVRATGLLGLPAENLHCLRAEDTMLPNRGRPFENCVNRLGEIGRIHGCSLIIGPWAGDPHCDHEAAAKMAKSLAERSGWTLYSYPVWGWLRDETEIFNEPRQGGWRLGISLQMERKKSAIAAHESQYGDLILDSPSGFKLPETLLAIFARNFEVYIA